MVHEWNMDMHACHAVQGCHRHQRCQPARQRASQHVFVKRNNEHNVKTFTTTTKAATIEFVKVDGCSGAGVGICACVCMCWCGRTMML